MQHITSDYGVPKSAICESIQWFEKTLIKSGKFKLSSKRNLLNNDSIGGVIIDVTDCEFERPKKKKKYYSGKRSAITLKV